MRRKAILLASVAGAVLGAGAPAQADGFYFSVLGGANFVEDQSGSFTTDFFRGKQTYSAHFDPDTGFLLGSAFGFGVDRWLHGLKVEAEASFRRNDVGGHWEGTNNNVNTITTDAVGAAATTSGSLSANMSTFALMANAWYEFNIGSRFKPYFGGGAGWARTHFDGGFQESNAQSVGALAINPFQGWSVDNSGFAYQLGAGVTSQIMPGVNLGLGYRYFDGPNTELFFGGKIIGPTSVGAAAVNDSNSIKFDNVSHSVALTLSIDIN